MRSSLRLTYDDFLNLPDEGKRHEIIDGEHYVSPSPNTAHQRIVMRLEAHLNVVVDMFERHLREDHGPRPS